MAAAAAKEKNSRRFMIAASRKTDRCDSCRGMPRLVATSRDRSHLLDIGNVLVHRRGRDQIFFAECGLDAAALKMTFGAIALNAAGRAGKAGAGIALDGLLDGESEVAVGACRDWSRRVVGHYVYDTAARPTSRRLSPAAERSKLSTMRGTKRKIIESERDVAS
jgi:hypothetical protein